ncbi:hypothetical protein [Streptomyces bluensis]|uniref:hypothetical protein n=1 Tax=Streptomyces bluensis TaxID=33897 RepID=UPI00167A24C8|nr:hypothetical protein [Streptomyces bluensis]GGZ77318.1 hypothetical protein GCM10010344_50470 [Streptomyces bluensis]
MAITEDLRKTLSDPTPLYFAAGTADLALQQAKKVPAIVEQIRAEAPSRIEAVRNTDPKVVQEKATARAKEAQEKAAARLKESQEKAAARAKEAQERAAVRAKEAQETLQVRITEILGSLDTDLKKLGETAQDLALRGVGVAAEYAVKARETYEKVAEHGEQAVRTWRGEAAEEIEELAVAVEPKSEPRPVEVKEQERPAVAQPAPAARPAPAAQPAPAVQPAPGASAKKPAPKKAPAGKKTTAKKITPPSK